jgi:division protein CdvB (Snf7/Vps24/ESCRT-III family)
MSKLTLQNTVMSIRNQMVPLDQAFLRLKERDTHLMEEMVRSLRVGQEGKARILSNELSQIRKVVMEVMSARLALEHITMRISTITDLGDIVATLTPAVGAIKGIQDVVTTVVPEADNSFSELSTILNGILVEASQTGGFKLDFKAANADAEKILDDASQIAEEEIRAKFPELPVTLGDQLTREPQYT